MEALCKGRKYFYIYVNIFLIAMLWSSMSMLVINIDDYKFVGKIELYAFQKSN